MKIGVISDIHDRVDTLSKAIKIFKDSRVEMIVHCGDWVSPFTLEHFDSEAKGLRVPVKSVLGNNEGDLRRIFERNSQLSNPVEFAPKTVFELEAGERKIVVYHGQDPAILNAFIKSGLYDAVFTGHTHVARNELIGKTLVLNPGTICFEANKQILSEASVAVYDSKTNSAQIINFK